ncbi:MAG TPA: cation-transporting P-type ATPase, partial [Acetivibrio sp.]|nr:cation-transporting P-type ATPase [Acetivibrio sp.]
MKHYFEDIEAVLKSQDTSKNGITSEQFQERLQKYGKNKLDEGKKKSIIVRFLEQLKDPMVCSAPRCQDTISKILSYI